MAASVCRVLMVYPAFFGETFWNYSEVCKLVGARYTAAPLGLITVAAMLPQSCAFMVLFIGSPLVGTMFRVVAPPIAGMCCWRRERLWMGGQRELKNGAASSMSSASR